MAHPHLGPELSAEYGSYNERKFSGFVNVPLNDVFSFRLAGMYLGRDGFQTNAFNGEKIDGRNLGSVRATSRLILFPTSMRH